MIARSLSERVAQALESFPICAIVGSRQVGKTTLAKMVAGELEKKEGQQGGGYVHLDLENPRDLNRLESPQLFLERQKNRLVIIDEIQRKPELFPLLRYLVDQGEYRFLVLGSSSPDLMRQCSESLAGRIHYLELSPFSLIEVDGKPVSLDSLWLRGGYPLSFLAENDEQSFRWRSSFVQTFVERDLPQLGIKIPAPAMSRFLMMTAHFHGQLWNANKMAQSMDMTSPSSKRYLDILENTFLLRALPPFLPNVKKRLIKSPKIYFRDSGLYHYFLDVMSFDGLMGHPNLGYSWEGFAVEEIIRRASEFSRFYFYRTSGGAEVDLVEIKPDHKPILYEMKFTSTPKPSKGLRSAMQDLQPEAVYIVYPGKESYPLEEDVCTLSLHEENL